MRRIFILLWSSRNYIKPGADCPFLKYRNESTYRILVSLSTSCNRVFVIFHKNASFQTKILNLYVVYKGLRIDTNIGKSPLAPLCQRGVIPPFSKGRLGGILQINVVIVFQWPRLIGYFNPYSF